MQISIVINNYNYGRFLRDAIDSALSQTYADKEVIVVDDGSTDDSEEIIQSYGERIRAVLKQNGGQGSAYNAGLKASTGDLIHFLDSDDVLKPNACEVIAAHHQPGTSKLQFPLSMVDENLNPLGHTLPTIKMLSGKLDGFVLAYGAYGSPPGSGNVYAREFLETVMPMPEPEWRICADAYLILQAPFAGDIVTIDQHLALYRQHRAVKPKSDSGTAALAGNAYGLVKLLTLLDQEERVVHETAQRCGITMHGSIRDHNPAFCKNLLCAKLLGQAPEGTPGRTSLAAKGFLCTLTFPMYSFRMKIMAALWFVWAGCCPPRYAVGSVRYALDPQARKPRPLATKEPNAI